MYKHSMNFSIAGINIDIKSNQFFDVSEKYKIFLNTSSKHDITIIIDTENKVDLGKCKTQCCLKDVDIYNYEDKMIKVKYIDDNKEDIDWCMVKEDDDLVRLVFYKPELHNFKVFNFLYFIELSSFLINFDATILHCSVIDYRGHGIIFTAPSGTGKSTQATLWETYMGAEIINGDRGIIRKTSHYNVYGSPFAGSSHIYKNRCVELKAIIILRQGSENIIRKINKKEAYLCLSSELSISSWSKEVVTRQMEWLSELIEEVTIYRMECRPDADSVRTLYKELGVV